MTVVLDCNILVSCLTSRSPYHYIYKSLVADAFKLVISNEILLEYEEIIQQKYGVATAGTFTTLLRELSKVHYVFPFYQWRLIDADADDNKYCDCAIAGNADFIVTEDKHFDILEKISFPEIEVVNITQFTSLLPAK